MRIFGSLDALRWTQHPVSTQLIIAYAKILLSSALLLIDGVTCFRVSFPLKVLKYPLIGRSAIPQFQSSMLKFSYSNGRLESFHFVSLHFCLSLFCIILYYFVLFCFVLLMFE